MNPSTELRANDAFLTGRGIVKHFGELAAVNGVDFEVAQGHVLALLGPSGCGKTTLLRMIAGFETPDEGTIELDGRVLNGPGVFVPPEKRRVAMVFQDFALFPHMTVGANIAFGLPKGTDKKRRIGELLDLVGLNGLESRMPHQLSGGQQQRVALARALAAEPALMLLDEPFSNLDPSIRARVRSEVKQLVHKVGITAVFVTHDQEEALSLAERVAVMISGRILQVGSPNFLPGEVHDSVVECELGLLPVTARFQGSAEVMVRAESLAIAEDGGTPAEVTGVEYYGHDQMVTVRTFGGRQLRVRLLAAAPFALGQRVGVVVRGDVFAFPKSA